jgi:hypothetical protein
VRYVVLENKHDGLQAIKLTEEPYEGIIYSYGKVSFDPNEETGHLKINFEYEIHDKNDKEFSDTKPFENYIGDILQELLAEGVANNSLTYVGGIDEN